MKDLTRKVAAALASVLAVSDFSLAQTDVSLFGSPLPVLGAPVIDDAYGAMEATFSIAQHTEVIVDVAYGQVEEAVALHFLSHSGGGGWDDRIGSNVYLLYRRSGARPLV